VGRPAVTKDGDVVVASCRGKYWLINGEDGTEIAGADVQEPIGAAPVLMGEQIVIASTDGAMRLVPLPAP
jgi:hypothetical protein